jgi:four helix bundle protein
MQNEESRMKKRDIEERTFRFGVQIVKIVNGLPRTPAGFELGKQAVRSGTSIGANIQEAQSAVSRLDFINKFGIALKEARETKYWLRVIEEADLTEKTKVKAILEENEEIIKILVTIIKNAKLKN